ncbi:MAG: hypothetical protein ACREEE_04295 [Dongiaceae bacterium]
MTARRRSRWLLPLVLLAVCGVLGAALYDRLNRTGPVGGANADPSTAAAAREPLPPESVFTMPPQDTYGAIIERPLFSPTRRPETGASFTPTDAGPEVTIKLIGVFITSTDRFALLKLDETAQSVRVSEGGEIAGWTVKEIHEFGAVLERDGETLELFLQYDDTPPPAETTEPVETEPPAEEVQPPEVTNEPPAGTTNQ